MTSPIDRILTQLGDPDLVDALADLSGADFTSLMLEVMRRRAATVAPAHVLERYAHDRFSTLPTMSFDALRRAEDAAVKSLPERCRMLALAPLVPFGTHHTTAAVDQNRIVSTTRGQEVAADPTNALALEAAKLRVEALHDDPKSTLPVMLAATQRVVRAQHVTGPARFAHFSLFGLVTAGRDTGSHGFECAAVAEQVAFHARCLASCGVERTRIELSDFADGAFASVLSAARVALAGMPGVDVVDVPERTRARGYYIGMAFRIDATAHGETFEIADGGFVDWTQKLVGSAKERCLVSGLGLDRLAMLHGVSKGV
jgi:hypothetical protein